MGNSALRPRRDDKATRRCKDAEAAVPAGGAATVAAAHKRPPVGKKVAESSAAAPVVTVKVVMSRKDAERLVAQLNEQNARGRKARMAELKNKLRAGAGAGGGGGGAVSPARRRDAWMTQRQRLAPIQEN